MRGKGVLLDFILITICIFSIVLVWFMFRHLKDIESEFNKEKNTLINEKLDLEDRIESIQEIIAQKKEAATFLEEEKESLENEISVLKGETTPLIQIYSSEIEVLKTQNASLIERMTALEKKPLLQWIQENLDKEKDESVQKILEKALDNIELIHTSRGGIKPEPSAVAPEPEPIIKTAKLKPAVETTKEEPAVETTKEEQLSASLFGVVGEIKRQGQVLFLDKNYNMVVINLGRRDDVKDGERCVILKDGKEIAQGEIIGVRYRVSAVLIDGFTYKYTLTDIDEGDDVLVIEEE